MKLDSMLTVIEAREIVLRPTASQITNAKAREVVLPIPACRKITKRGKVRLENAVGFAAVVARINMSIRI